MVNTVLRSTRSETDLFTIKQEGKKSETNVQVRVTSGSYREPKNAESSDDKIPVLKFQRKSSKGSCGSGTRSSKSGEKVTVRQRPSHLNVNKKLATARVSPRRLVSPANFSRKKFSFSETANQIKNFLAPDYNTRNDEFKRLFKFDGKERFIADYSCAFQREILVHGRMYISENWLCFHANIFSWETRLTINFKDIVSITKKKTVKFIPNAVQVYTSDGHKLFFTSFATRSKTLSVLNKIWKACLADKKLDFDYIWHFVHDPRHRSQASMSTTQKRAEKDKFKAKSRIVSEPASFDFGTSDINLGLHYEDQVKKSAVAESSDGRCLPLTNQSLASTRAPPPDGPPKTNFVLLSTPSSTEGSGHDSSTRSSNTASTSSTSDDSNLSDNVFETSCTCETHFGAQMLNEVLPVAMETLFDITFEQGPSAEKFRAMRKFSDYVHSNWQPKSNAAETTGAQVQTRTVTYRTELDYSIGPRSCKVVESQELNHSKDNQLTVICECHNVGIPYGDIFDIGMTYCITKVSNHTCRLRGFGGIIYRKNCWGFFKTFLEKNAFSGMDQHFTDLKKHLRNECDLINCGKRTSIDLFHSCTSLYEALSKSRLNTRHKDVNRLRRDSRRPPSHPVNCSTWTRRSVQTFFTLLTIIMIVLLCLNLLLYTNLWIHYRSADHEYKSIDLTSSKKLCEDDHTKL